MTPTAGDVERLERRLERRLGQAIGDFELIEPGDRVLVGVSGGKDSWAWLLGALSRVDLASLPIPGRQGARVGDLLPVLALVGERSGGG